jgi:hypothetical protein
MQTLNDAATCSTKLAQRQQDFDAFFARTKGLFCADLGSTTTPMTEQPVYIYAGQMTPVSRSSDSTTDNLGDQLGDQLVPKRCQTSGPLPDFAIKVMTTWWNLKNFTNQMHAHSPSKEQKLALHASINKRLAPGTTFELLQLENWFKHKRTAENLKDLELRYSLNTLIN